MDHKISEKTLKERSLKYEINWIQSVQLAARQDFQNRYKLRTAWIMKSRGNFKDTFRQLRPEWVDKMLNTLAIRR